jgi:hypothetical protein
MKLLPKLAAAAAVMVASTALASDHIDAPAVTGPDFNGTGDPATDVTDVYAWNDGNNVALVLDVFPNAKAASKFTDTVQYVLHTESTTAFGMPGTKKDIIATFDAQQKIQVWLGTDDYATGDASDAATGLTSMGGKFKVFAGLRDDPFFFNLAGFKRAVARVDAAEGALTFDMAGCPAVDPVTSSLLVNDLKQDGMTPPGAGKDFFTGLNTLAIVISVDRAAVTAGGPFLSVWGSTNKGM